MLNPEIKKFIIDQTPGSVTINNNVVTINKVVGSVPLNKLVIPSVNIQFIGEGTPYYRSIDDEAVYTETSLVESDIRSVIVRYTVGVKDVIASSSETFTYKTGQTAYTLSSAPVKQIKSVGSYVNGTDYKLSPNHDSIIWLKSLPNNTTFIVTYDWIDSGFFVCSELINSLINNALGTLRYELARKNINVLRVSGVTDLSEIYANDALNACSCDITLTYPYSWSRTITDDDGSLLDQMDVDVIVNENLVDTIVVSK